MCKYKALHLYSGITLYKKVIARNDLNFNYAVIVSMDRLIKSCSNVKFYETTLHLYKFMSNFDQLTEFVNADTLRI